MNFSISGSTENGLDQLILKDENSGSSVSVLPGHGALLHSFTIPSGKGLFNVIDQYTDLEHVQNELGLSFKGSKLSPFACRIPGGKYNFNDHGYELTNKFPDGSAIHGLLYNKIFSVIDKFTDHEKASVALQYVYNKDEKGYPFNYRCTIRYTLFADNILEIQTTISNVGNEEIPIADGWHPYFTLGGDADDWLMHFESISQLEFDDKLIPTGKLLPYEVFNEPRRIGHTELDNCFLIKVQNDRPSCEIFNPETKIRVSFFPDSTYPYLQIYIPPHRKSIAIENLSAPPDSFNNKIGLISLLPGDSQIFTLHYKVSVV